MLWRRASAAAVILATTSIASCKDDPSATVAITVGEELDAFSRAPAPTTLIVENVGLDGTVSLLSRSTLPADQISLGDKPKTDAGAFRVTGLDATGKVLLKGESLFVQFGALENAALEVFVQRTGELARFPRGPAQLDSPRVSIAVGRYIVAATDTSTFLYDLMLLTTAPPLPVLSRPAKSLATFGTAAVIVDEVGATTLDLSSGSASDLPAPTGGTFAEIAGGETIQAGDGSFYIVGATRASGPTERVYAVATDGTARFAALVTPREGACAAWVDGRGLFVYGGGGAEAAGELLAPGSSVFTKLPLAADPVKGCGATALDTSHVLVVGGVGSPTDVNGAAQARVIDLACTVDCKPAPWPGTLPLVRAGAMALGANAALVLGEDASGASRVFRAAPDGPKEIPLKVPRRGARLTTLPVAGTAAIVGGAPSIERYVD
jgi:hypothetical protein